MGTEFKGGRESQCEELHLHTKEVSPKDTLSHLFDNTAATGNGKNVMLKKAEDVCNRQLSVLKPVAEKLTILK